MKSFHSRPKPIRTSFAALLGAVLIAGCSVTTAWAEDDTDGEDPTLLDTQILQYVLKGMGWKRGDEEKGIQYRERSPLVLPNSPDLPPPEKSTPATKTAGWPDDPDVKRAKKKRDAERKRKSYTEGVDDRPLLPNQVAGQPATGRGDGPTLLPGSGKTAEEASKPSTRQELGSKSIFSKVWGDKQEQATFTGEPPRDSLIEPPAGYRTPSPNQPYGIGKDSWSAPKIDRQEPVK